MRPQLFSISALVPFVVALLAAVVLALISRRRLQSPDDTNRSDGQNRSAGGVGIPGWSLALLAALLVWIVRGPGLPTPAALFEPARWRLISVNAYGLALALALIAGWFITMSIVDAKRLSVDAAGALYMWSTLGALVGARVLYVITNPAAFDGLSSLVSAQKGGLVAYGGMLGGGVASALLCKRNKWPFLLWADAVVPAIAAGTALTRIGCFLYGCDYGLPHDGILGVSFPRHAPAWENHRTAGWIGDAAARSLPVHPTQLYEAALGAGLFLGLWLLRRRGPAAGLGFAFWLGGYGAGRALIELWRGDDERGGLGPLSTSQILGIVAFLAALFVWHKVRAGAGSGKAL